MTSSSRYRLLTPPSEPKGEASSTPDADFEEVTVCEVAFIEPGTVATRPVPIQMAEFKQTLQRLTRDMRSEGTPQQAARELLEALRQEQEVERVSMSGHWEAASYRGRVYSLMPVKQSGPVPLTPEAEEALRGKYLGWCEGQGGGDCLGLIDKVGDQLQEAVIRAARAWGPQRLSRSERAAIQRARKQGKYWLARLLEREARGRFVHARVKRQFEEILRFQHQGVDIVDLKTGRKYEILSGTESNLARHGRRMASKFFRMLTF